MDYVIVIKGYLFFTVILVVVELNAQLCLIIYILA